MTFFVTSVGPGNGADLVGLARADKTHLPVVLVIQEIFGVHEYIADTCRRFAKAGYLAIALSCMRASR